MLVSLHVKNLAIIEEEEIEFGKGLNILSGETGAGKSIILGALGLAMGEKTPKGLIRDESKEALAEAVFSVNDRQKVLLEQIEVDTPDNEVILQRKISPQRTTARINGESMPASKLAQAANILIDIYGQHEQQTLLSKKNHIILLDEYAKEELSSVKEALSIAYDKYKTLISEYNKVSMDESERVRETDLLSHEIAEIESANIIVGEDKELKEEYRKLSKAQKVLEAVKEAESACGESVTEEIGRAIRAMHSVEDVDERIIPFINMLADAENILTDAKRSLSDFENELELSPKRLMEVSERIDLLDSLKRKFSKNEDLSGVLITLEDNKLKLDKLNDYENYVEELKKKIKTIKKSYDNLCDKITYIRKKTALELTGLINEALKDLNVSGNGSEIVIEPSEEQKRVGKDEVSFFISTNPGEAARPLDEIASGGELSRIMLAIKTIFAGSGEIDTLVFDEIDSGVSGRTAARVADRLSTLSKTGQVICITHLPQIASRANRHFLIEKLMDKDSTVSSIRALSEDERIKEVARMLAGDNVTPAAIENARILILGEDAS